MRNLFIAFTTVLICAPALANAQATKDAKNAAPTGAAAPVSSNPERTTASFGDWVMRCEYIGTPAKRTCEAAQIMTVQGQSSPIAQLAVGKPAGTSGKQATLVVPANVALAGKPQIAIAKAGATPIDLVWQRCTPGGCFASTQITDAALAILSAEAEPGRILFKDAADRDVALPLSFRGLTQALEALAKEP